MSVEKVQDIFTSVIAEERGLYQTYFISIHRELCLIEENAQWDDQVLAQLQLYKMELRFHERFSQWASACRRSTDVIFSAEKKFRRIWRHELKGLLATRLSQIRGGYVTDWHPLARELKQRLEDSKLVIEEWCKGFLSSSNDKILPGGTSLPQRDEILPQIDEILIFFLDAILINLMGLLSYKASETIPQNDQIETLKMKLVFLRNILKVTAGCIYDKDFQKLKSCTFYFANNAACQTFLCWAKAADEDNANEMDLMVSDILLRIKPCMLDEMALYFRILKYKGSTRDNIVRYLNAILNNLKDLVRYKAAKIVPLTMQMEPLEQKLLFLQDFSNLAANCVNSGDFIKFMNYVHDFSKNAAWLTLLYWLKTGDEQTTSEMIRMLSNMLQKIDPRTRDVTNVYFGTLKAMRLQRSNTHLLGHTVVTMADLLLENLVTVKDFQILRDELIFVLAFLADSPIKNANNDELTLVLQKIDVLLRERWHLISSVDTIEMEVRNFQREIEIVNARIRRLYDEYSYSSVHDFPGIICQGFLDFLIRNFKNLKEQLTSDTKSVPFVKYSIWKIEEELVSLRPLFNDILELQKDQREPSDARSQLINLAYLSEHVVNSCFVVDYPVSYRMACLHDLLNKIKDVKTKCEKIKEFSVYNVGVLRYSGTSTSILSKQAWTSDINQKVVGFEEEANIIIDQLTCGHKSLDIVSIVGMGGLGKTTLARKVYDAPSVKNHFHIFAFCSVSRDYNAKRLLLDILSNFIVIDDAWTKDDLAHQLRKRLSGRRYLIVMDDMWEVRAWNDVKNLFRDDQNGSRVMLTTRILKVAEEAQMNYRPYHLGFLSEEKSWALLQNKVFSNGSCPPNFYDIGNLIAKNCKGLPLAVVLIAGLLKRTEKSLSWWNEIAQRVVSYLSKEGCIIKMLEFSYKYLPEYLKPLLLYFGGFPEDTLISWKSLMLLWINEGFVQESNTKSLEDVAKDYLHDLVDRSLVIVTGRSSNGGIKTIGVHDLIHDFCRTKAQAENFFQLSRGNASSSSSDHPIYNHYRVCMQMAGETTVQSRGNASSSSSDHPKYNHYRVSMQMAGETSIQMPGGMQMLFGMQMLGETMVDVTPTFPCVRSLLSFQRCNDPFDTLSSIIGKFKLLQVLHLENMWLEEKDLEQMSVLVDLRHIVAPVNHVLSVPSSISNLWALETFILRTMRKGDIRLPETIWKMKWLRHVNISRCKLIFPGGHEHEVFSKLENVESFSSPTLSTGKDLEKLLQRLPAVRKLSCRFDKSCDSLDKRNETLDFLNQIESLNLAYIGYKNPYVINFPSTLKKLKLVGFKLPWTAISDIEKLQHLEVLKLLWNSFTGPMWEMEDVIFPSLKFLKLDGLNLVRWNAFPESFPCLEQLSVNGCDDLVEIPPCFGEILTLKRFEVHVCRKATSSATEIVNKQMDSGNDTLDVDISYGGY